MIPIKDVERHLATLRALAVDLRDLLRERVSLDPGDSGWDLLDAAEGVVTAIATISRDVSAVGVAHAAAVAVEAAEDAAEDAREAEIVAAAQATRGGPHGRP